MSITTGKLEPSSICDGSTSIINNQKSKMSKNEAEEHVCFKGGTKMNLNNFASGGIVHDSMPSRRVLWHAHY